MGWKTINGRKYLYRSVHEGGRVRSKYLGTGQHAEQLADLDEILRAENIVDREEERERREADRDEDRALDELVSDARAVASAALIAAGYHNHRGQWRKRRG